MINETYIGRLLDARIGALFAQLPAILLTGPRACGKTTTAARQAASTVRLDRPADAAAFLDDPDEALAAQPIPVLLDEWQAVPEVLGAVKRAVDSRRAPGRFLLTGSVRAALTGQTWPGTGRLIWLRMYGLTVREMRGKLDGPGFLDRLATGSLDSFPGSAEIPGLRDYVGMALKGGYPEPALALDAEARRQWLRSYIDQLVTRDADTLTDIRDPVRFRRYFQAIALNTAGIVAHSTLYDAAQVDAKTAAAYDRLLASLFIVDSLPAWVTNRLSRLAKRPKRYVVDPGLVGAELELDEQSVFRSGDMLGRLIDTFVMSQIRPELELSSSSRWQLYHFRDQDGREVDIVAEIQLSKVVAVEIKSTATPTVADARHLIWLRDQLGDRFLAGAVLHTGPRPFRLSDRIFALPIYVLWN